MVVAEQLASANWPVFAHNASAACPCLDLDVYCYDIWKTCFLTLGIHWAYFLLSLEFVKIHVSMWKSMFSTSGSYLFDGGIRLMCIRTSACWSVPVALQRGARHHATRRFRDMQCASSSIITFNLMSVSLLRRAICHAARFSAIRIASWPNLLDLCVHRLAAVSPWLPML